MSDDESLDGYCGADPNAARAVLERRKSIPVVYGSHWRHKARNTSYRVLGAARVQVSDIQRAMHDNDEPLLYQDIHSPEKYEVRFVDEFADGRFELIPTNKPIIDDFMLGLSVEAQHQRERWGEAHDRSKSAENWYWLVGYLAGKALRAAVTGDKTVALHHTVSAAAALMQWHAAIFADTSGAGVGIDADLSAEDLMPDGSNTA